MLFAGCLFARSLSRNLPRSVHLRSETSPLAYVVRSARRSCMTINTLSEVMGTSISTMSAPISIALCMASTEFSGQFRQSPRLLIILKQFVREGCAFRIKSSTFVCGFGKPRVRNRERLIFLLLNFMYSVLPVISRIAHLPSMMMPYSAGSDFGSAVSCARPYHSCRQRMQTECAIDI